MKSCLICLILVLAAIVYSQPTLDTVWTRTFSESSIQKLASVVETRDHKLVFAGNIQSDTSGMDSWVLALDSTGQTIWEVTISEPGDQFATDLEVLDDGGFIVVGSSMNSFGTMAIRLDSNGNLIWYRVYQTHYDPTKISVATTSDSGFVIATHVSPPSHLPRRACTLWVSGNGDSLTCGIAAAGNSENNELNFVHKSMFSDIFVAGWQFRAEFISEPPQFLVDSWLLWAQLRQDGSFVRQRLSGHIGSTEMRCQGVKSSPDGRIWLLYNIVPYFYTGGIIMLDTLTYRPMISFGRPSIDFVPVAGNEFVVFDDTLFATDRDFRIFRYDSAGHPLWELPFGGPFDQRALSLEQTENGDFILLGTTSNLDSGDVDAVIMRISNNLIVESEEHPSLVQSFLFSSFPNPFNPSTTLSFNLPRTENISIKIYNIEGREVVSLLNGLQTAGTHDLYFNGSDLSSGIYFARMETTSGITQTKKLVLLK